MKIGIIIMLVAAVTIAAMYAAGAVSPSIVGRDIPEPQIVRVESPSRNDLSELVSAPGEVEPRKRVSLSARISARIDALPHEEGDRVTRGGKGREASLLIRLDASDLEANLRSAEARRAAQAAQIDVSEARIESQRANLAGIRVSLEEARRDLQRQSQLFESKDVSEAVVDQARKTVDELEASLEANRHTLRADELNIEVMRLNLVTADAEIARAEEDLRHTTITSPIDGTVTRINAEEGELVITGTMNNPGTVIMEVADLSRMLFVAQVDETDIGELEAGQSATVRLQAYPDREFTGVVETIALSHDTSNTGSKYFKTEIAMDTGGDRIYSGLTGDAQIETRKYKNVLTVPSQAVLGRRVDELPPDIRKDNPNIDSDKTFAAVAYRYLDSKAVATPVTIGPSDAMRTVILDGLDENDRVIVGPYKVLEALRHDQAVRDEEENQS